MNAFKKQILKSKEIEVNNSLQFNNELYNEFNEITKYPPMTKDLMKITLNKLVECNNKTSLAGKRLFYLKCLELI